MGGVSFALFPEYGFRVFTIYDFVKIQYLLIIEIGLYSSDCFILHLLQHSPLLYQKLL